MRCLGYHRLAAVAAALIFFSLACGDDSSGSGDGGLTTGSNPGATTPTTTPSVTGATSMGMTTSGESDASTGGTAAADDGTSGAATGPDAVCPASHQCVREAPTGWSGPGTKIDDLGGDPACAGAYPDPLAVAFGNVVAEPASCACSCGDAVGATCETNTQLLYYGLFGQLLGQLPFVANGCGEHVCPVSRAPSPGAVVARAVGGWRWLLPGQSGRDNLTAGPTGPRHRLRDRSTAQRMPNGTSVRSKTRHRPAAVRVAGWATHVPRGVSPARRAVHRRR